jgi:hypothetical protein
MYVTKTHVYHRKTEKFFVSEEKKFGRIDSRVPENPWVKTLQCKGVEYFQTSNLHSGVSLNCLIVRTKEGFCESKKA